LIIVEVTDIGKHPSLIDYGKITAVKSFTVQAKGYFAPPLFDEEKKFSKVDTCGQCYKTFYGLHNKQERLSLVGLSSLAYCLRERL
jgi:hypothetical protein